MICTNCMKSVIHMNPHEMDVFGTVKVGERGQVVIPSGARKKLGIKPGDFLLVVSTPPKDGVALIKVEVVKGMIEKMRMGLGDLGSQDRRTPRRKAGE